MKSPSTRRKKQIEPLIGLLLCAALLLFVTLMFIHDSSVEEPYTEVQGTLKELTQLSGSGRWHGIRFTLLEYPVDFHIDPMVASGLRKQGKGTIRTGAHVTVTVSARELISPSHPLLRQELSVVWVYGLKVDGRRIFSPEYVARIDTRNDRWGLAIIAFCILGCGYFAWRSWMLVKERRAAKLS